MHETIVYIPNNENRPTILLSPDDDDDDNFFITVGKDEICLWSVNPFKIISKLSPSTSYTPVRQILPNHLPTQNWISKRGRFHFIISYNDNLMIGFCIGDDLLLEEISPINSMGEINGHQRDPIHRTYGSTLKITKNRSSFILQEINNSVLILNHPDIPDLSQHRLLIADLNFTMIDKLIVFNKMSRCSFVTSTPKGLIKVFSFNLGKTSMIWERDFNAKTLVMNWINSFELLVSFSSHKSVTINPFTNEVDQHNGGGEDIVDILSYSNYYLNLCHSPLFHSSTSLHLNVLPRIIYDNCIYKMDFYKYYPLHNTLYLSNHQSIRDFPLIDGNSIIKSMDGIMIVGTNDYLSYYNGSKFFNFPGTYSITELTFIRSKEGRLPFLLFINYIFEREEIVLYDFGNGGRFLHRQYTTTPLKGIFSSSPSTFLLLNNENQVQQFVIEDDYRIRMISQHIITKLNIKKIFYNVNGIIFYSTEDNNLYDADNLHHKGVDFFITNILKENYLFIIGKDFISLYYLNSLDKLRLIHSFTEMDGQLLSFLRNSSVPLKMDLIARYSNMTTSPSLWTPLLFHLLKNDLKSFKSLSISLFSSNQQGFLLLELLLVYILRKDDGMDNQDRLMNLIKVTLSPLLPPFEYRNAIVSFLRHIEASDSFHLLEIFGPYNSFFDICCQSGQCDLAWILLRQYSSNLFGDWNPCIVVNTDGVEDDDNSNNNNSNNDADVAIRYSAKDCLMICNNFQLLLTNCNTSSIIRDAIRLFDELPHNCQYDTKWFSNIFLRKIILSHDYLVLLFIFKSKKASLHLTDGLISSLFKEIILGDGGQSREDRMKLILIFNDDLIDYSPSMRDDIISLIERELTSSLTDEESLMELELFKKVFPS